MSVKLLPSPEASEDEVAEDLNKTVSQLVSLKFGQGKKNMHRPRWQKLQTKMAPIEHDVLMLHVDETMPLLGARPKERKIREIIMRL